MITEDRITENFVRSEFACSCCGADDISGHLVRKLQAVRDALGRSISITSGVRCVKHNISINGSPTSSHLDRVAADLAVLTSEYRGQILPLLLMHFNRVGIGPDFCHVDIDESKTIYQNGKAIKTVWTY